MGQNEIRNHQFYNYFFYKKYDNVRKFIVIFFLWKQGTLG